MYQNLTLKFNPHNLCHVQPTGEIHQMENELPVDVDVRFEQEYDKNVD